MAGDVAALMDRLDLLRAHVLDISMGGRIAMALALAVLGTLGARLGGGDQRRATARVVGWGALAMAVTAGIGALVGAAV